MKARNLVARLVPSRTKGQLIKFEIKPKRSVIVRTLVKYSVIYSVLILSVLSANNLLPRASADITSGLVGYWTFDEAEGTVIRDSSGSNNDGTIQESGPVWTTNGRLNAALVFGPSDNVDLPNSTSLNVAGDITISFWTKYTGGGGVIIGGASNSSPSVGYSIRTFTWHNKLAFWAGDHWITNNTPLNDGNWHHFTVTVSGTTANFFRDGIGDGSVANIIPPGSFSGTKAIGSNSETGASFYDFFIGSLDEVRIYDRALSAAEVQDLYSYVPPPPVISGVSAPIITSSGATVSWNTDKTTDSQVEYGLTPLYGSTTALEPTLTKRHYVLLSGLQAGTTYHFRVKSNDNTGHLVTSGDFTFMTNAPIVPVPSQLSVTSPQPNWTVSGVITFTVNTGLLTGVSSVQYLLNERPLYDGDVPAQPVTNSPFSYTWHSGNVWDSENSISAVARDASGKVIATSPPVSFNIANGPTTLSLISPSSDPTQTLNGTINWTVQTNYPADSSTRTFLYYLDGKIIGVYSTTGQRMTNFLDTTKLPNGRHELFTSLHTASSIFNQAVAMSQVMVDIQNGRTPMELRANYKRLFLTPSQQVRLSAKLVYTNLDEEAAIATFASDNATIASVDNTGVVNGISPGVTNITITSGVRAATVKVVVDGDRLAPHFSKGGQILTTYDPARSTFLRTMFFLNSGEFTNNPNLGPAVQQAAVNALTSGFYWNPGDNPAQDVPLEQYVAGLQPVLNSITEVADQYDLNIFLTGDDIARNRVELHDSATNPNSAAKIKYVIGWARDTGKVIAIDMVDEVDLMWGDTPTPNDGRWLSYNPPSPDNAFTTLMGIINEVPGRPRIGWPNLGGASLASVQNWSGNPSFADFATIFFQDDYDWFGRTYPSTASLPEVLTSAERRIDDRLPVLQRDKPMLLLVGATGPDYQKLVSGDHYSGGLDKIQYQGASPEGVSVQIMTAVARGMAGVRVYGYDTELSKSARSTSPLGSLVGGGTDPFTVGAGRWKAMSVAFNLVKILEPFILQPQTHALDFGPNIITGAKDGPQGKLVIAVNALETKQTIKADLSSYLNGDVANITRYRLTGSAHTSQSIPLGTTAESLDLEPGETVIWTIQPADIIPLSNDIYPPTVTITSPPNASGIAAGLETNIEATASDNVGIVRVEFYVDGILRCTSAESPYSCLWEIPPRGSVPVVPHALQAIGYDATGNIGISPIVVVLAR